MILLLPVIKYKRYSDILPSEDSCQHPAQVVFAKRPCVYNARYYWTLTKAWFIIVYCTWSESVLFCFFLNSQFLKFLQCTYVSFKIVLTVSDRFKARAGKSVRAQTQGGQEQNRACSETDRTFRHLHTMTERSQKSNSLAWWTKWSSAGMQLLVQETSGQTHGRAQ